MASTVDFNKMRKRRQRTQALRRLLALFLLMGGIAGLFALNNLLIEEAVPTRIGDVLESLGGTGYPIAVPGGVIRDVKNVGNHLAVLNDTNLYVYNAKGKQVNNIQQMGETGVARTSSSRVLVFDAGKKRYGLYSKTRPLVEQNVENGIITGAVNDRGDYAIVTASRQYVAETHVYNRQHDEIYYWSSAENVVLDIALSPRGDRMAVGCLNTENGVLKSIVLVFRFDSQEEQDVRRLELPGDMLLRVEFPENDRVTVLTDRRYTVLDNQANEQHTYAFGERAVVASETRGRDTALLFDTRAAKASEIVLLGADCQERAVLAPNKPVRDMALGRDRLYLLTEDGIAAYNMHMQEKRFVRERGIHAIHLIGSTLYYITDEEIRVLDATSGNDAGGTQSDAGSAQPSSVREPAAATQREPAQSAQTTEAAAEQSNRSASSAEAPSAGTESTPHR